MSCLFKKFKFKHKITDKPPPLVFGSTDLHDGPRIDIPSLLSHLGQETVLMGHKNTATPYPFVFQSPGIKIYPNFSLTVRRYTSHSYRLSEQDIQENTDYYSAGNNIILD